MKTAYLVNQYPKVSHSFIRREIVALERRGLSVLRIALRGWDAELADADDVRERHLTRYVLKDGKFSLLLAAISVLARSPRQFANALLLACRMGRRADRPLIYHIAYLLEACRVLHWLQAERVSHLHAHFGTNPAEVAMLCHVLGGPPFSFTVHGPEEFDKPEFIHLDEKVRRASFVVAISSYCRSQLLRWLDHEDWQKVKVVHCGIEQAFYAVNSRNEQSSRRLVCVGRLCEQKGQLLLVEAAAQLARRNVRFELVLAGDGEMRADIEALIARHGLGATVTVTGWISGAQVRDEVLASRALVSASFAEGLPVVLMEAMALRRPVISTWVAGIPELVVPQHSGWLFAPGDVEGLAAAIEDCLARPLEELQKMGDAGHLRAVERHDIDVEAGKLAALFAKAGDTAQCAVTRDKLVTQTTDLPAGPLDV